MRARLSRALHLRPDADPAPASPRLRLVPEPGTPAADEFAAERRLREGGGPEDQATYGCSCGYVFEADVSTSVACPHCGTAQAW